MPATPRPRPKQHPPQGTIESTPEYRHILSVPTGKAGQDVGYLLVLFFNGRSVVAPSPCIRCGCAAAGAAMHGYGCTPVGCCGPHWLRPVLTLDPLLTPQTPCKQGNGPDMQTTPLVVADGLLKGVQGAIGIVHHHEGTGGNTQHPKRSRAFETFFAIKHCFWMPTPTPYNMLSG